MTRYELTSSVPVIIEHNAWGEAKLIVMADTDDKKGVGYKDRDSTTCYKTYGESWIEVYEKLIEKIEEGVKTGKIIKTLRHLP